MSPDSNQPSTLVQHQQSHARLANTLADIGFIWPGTVQKQLLTCGKPRCRCHKDPKLRHGPYWYWTSKKKGKTVSRKLTPEEAEIIGQWIENRRRLDATLKQMMQTSQRLLPLLLRQAAERR